MIFISLSKYIDDAIMSVSPVSGLKRIQARKAAEFLNSGFSHHGASHEKKSMVGWDYQSKTPQEDIDYNLPPLRERSRDLYMSSPIATSAIKTNRANVVGCGLRLKSHIDYDWLGISKEDAERWERGTEREFNLWAESKYCDSMRLNNFYELQQLALVSWLLDGDAFGIVQHGEATAYMPYSLRLQMIEADRINTPEDYANINEFIGVAKNGHRIYNGVEIDSSGTVKAYYICNNYPDSDLSSFINKWVRIEAFGEKTGFRNILHIMESERPEQYRGVPYLSPVIEQLKQIGRYAEAELSSATISAYFTIFVQTKDSASSNPLGEAIEDYNRIDDDNETTYEMGPGTVNYMREGEEINSVNPTRPMSGFELFTKAIAMQIGAALELPYEMILKSFDSSYSASRAAFQEAWKVFRMRRTWFADDFCQPIYEIWLSEAVALGRVEAPGFFSNPLAKKAWCGAKWNGPAPGQIDPKKEVEAAVLRVDNGFSNRTRETMELTGENYADNVRQLASENKLLREARGEKLELLGNQEPTKR